MYRIIYMSNNKHINCPPIMSDGRHTTIYEGNGYYNLKLVNNCKSNLSREFRSCLGKDGLNNESSSINKVACDGKVPHGEVVVDKNLMLASNAQPADDRVVESFKSQFRINRN